METSKGIKSHQDKTSYNLISRSLCSQEFQDYAETVANVHHLWSESKAGVDADGMYARIIIIRIENCSFGCNLIYEIWISDGPGPATG